MPDKSSSSSSAAGANVFEVLIVDDDFRVADIHKGYVEGVAGFDVVGIANTGQQALELVESLRPDLVLLDIYLPDGHGTEILARIRREQPVDVIVLTAARDLRTVKRCLDLGALHYIIKPFGRNELVNRLREYRQWRQSWASRTELDQQGVDQMFHGRGRPDVTLPKGLSSETMELVIDTLAGSVDPLGAEDVSQLTGISRVSVRRYLRHLADSGRADLIQDYGTPGRPRHRFQLSS